jgi:hypothetical protein
LPHDTRVVDVAIATNRARSILATHPIRAFGHRSRVRCGRSSDPDRIARRIAFAQRNGLVIGSWIEEPLLISVYAADRPTLDAMIEAVINAPKPT